MNEIQFDKCHIRYLKVYYMVYGSFNMMLAVPCLSVMAKLNVRSVSFPLCRELCSYKRIGNFQKILFINKKGKKKFDFISSVAYMLKV